MSSNCRRSIVIFSANARAEINVLFLLATIRSTHLNSEPAHVMPISSNPRRTHHDGNATVGSTKIDTDDIAGIGTLPPPCAEDGLGGGRRGGTGVGRERTGGRSRGGKAAQAAGGKSEGHDSISSQSIIPLGFYLSGLCGRICRVEHKYWTVLAEPSSTKFLLGASALFRAG